MKLRLNRKIDSKSNDAGLFGLYRFYHARDGMTLQLHPWRVLTVLAILAMFAYIGAVSVAYYVRSQEPYNKITFTDVALFPFRYEQISEKVGQSNLEHGKARFEDKDYKSALVLLRGGLKRAPGDHEARKMLAMIYQAAGNSEAATNILGIGLDYGYPEDQEYVDILLTLLALREDYGGFGEISYKLRQFPQVQKNEERWEALADLELKVLKRERDYEQMLEFSREMQAAEPDDPQYRDLEALSLIMLGFNEEARGIMEDMPLARRHSPQFRYLEAMMAMQNSDFEAMEELNDKIMQWPTKPFTLQAQLIKEMDYAGLVDRRDQRLKEFLEQHQQEPLALELAVRLFYENLGVDKIDAILARLNDFAPERAIGLQLYAIQARLFAGQPQIAQQKYNAWVQHEQVAKQLSKYDWLDQLLTVLNEKREDDRKTFWDLTRENRYPNSTYIVSVRALLEGKDYETAERIAENGLLYYPHNETLAKLRREAASAR